MQLTSHRCEKVENVLRALRLLCLSCSACKFSCDMNRPMQSKVTTRAKVTSCCHQNILVIDHNCMLRVI